MSLLASYVLHSADMPENKHSRALPARPLDKKRQTSLPHSGERPWQHHHELVAFDLKHYSIDRSSEVGGSERSLAGAFASVKDEKPSRKICMVAKVFARTFERMDSAMSSIR